MPQKPQKECPDDKSSGTPLRQGGLRGSAVVPECSWNQEGKPGGKNQRAFF